MGTIFPAAVSPDTAFPITWEPNRFTTRPLESTIRETMYGFIRIPLFAIAENDDENQPEAKDVLRDAFARAGLSAEIEVYAGAMHGWCPPDSTVYHQVQAERAWSRLLALLENGLA